MSNSMRKVVKSTSSETIDGVTTVITFTIDTPLFPSSCKFCKQDNVCEKPGQSCGKRVCDLAFSEFEKEAPYIQQFQYTLQQAYDLDNFKDANTLFQAEKQQQVLLANKNLDNKGKIKTKAVKNYDVNPYYTDEQWSDFRDQFQILESQQIQDNGQQALQQFQ